ncbi:serine/threonine protein kinase [Deinococcus maricopensis DSM 21211]|uniref:Serine/threonine protein kinase n=2 Tax=Deinococcus TaxID=1298 RepID=E8U7A7_DEIML|nr:serine/threonine protein kinase [Deinococcus maricopensis DSM 21211]
MRVERARWEGRWVIVKTISHDHPDVIRRFHREGEIAARLAHPNIVPLLAHTRTQLVYQFVDGPTLRDHLRGRRAPPREAFRLFRGVMSAIAYAHARGIMHLDLKPENVMLEDGRAVVTDFGMSHDTALTRITSMGERMGTPHYMAPEQYKGVRDDPRSDLYAVTVMLFEALAGVPPHPDPLGWLSGTNLERLPLPGPPALHPLMECGLARDPEGRPPSAMSMLIELERAEEHLQS